MAAVITETKLLQIGGGTEGRARLFLSVANDTTTFTIIPGHNDVNVSGSSGLTTIDTWGWSNSSAGNAPQIVKSQNNTYDVQQLAFTTASGDDYTVWVEGPYIGS